VWSIRRATLSHQGSAPRQLVWVRANGRLPDAPLLHHCVAAYASDMTLLDTATVPHGISWAFMNPRY
jgi:acyl-CoA thioesterase-2